MNDTPERDPWTTSDPTTPEGAPLVPKTDLDAALARAESAEWFRDVWKQVAVIGQARSASPPCDHAPNRPEPSCRVRHSRLPHDPEPIRMSDEEKP